MRDFNAVGHDLQAIDGLLDQIEELAMALPIRAGQKKIIQSKIYDLYTEIEDGVEVSSVDFD